MNKSTLLLAVIVFFISACNSTDKQLSQAKALYHQALENKDAATVKVALNQLLLLDSTSIEYQDSLSRVYMRNGNFIAGLKYAELVYNAGKAEAKLKENMALAYQ